MDGIEPNASALLLFAAAFAIWCLSFFTLTGMLPLSARPQAVADPTGNALLLTNLVLLLALLAGVALFAHQTLRWTSIIVFGGLVFLFTPSIFQIIPKDWRDSRNGLAAIVGVQIGALVLLLSLQSRFPTI